MTHLTPAPARPSEHTRAGRRRVRQGALWLWAVVAFVVTGSLASAHEYTLPHPTREDRLLHAALSAQRTPAEAGRFGVTHVMYAACQCSQAILDHLAARGARKDVAERVVLVGHPDETDALAERVTHAGFRLETVEPVELERKYGLQAAPLLIIANAHDDIMYMGGYTAQKQGPDIRDTALIDQLLAGKHAAELPLLGCAVSRALQLLLDPFGLKYPEERR
jgi:hypothetical protein